MKYVKLLLLIVIAAGLGYILNKSVSLGSTTLPPLGNFLCPYTGYMQNAESSPGSDLTFAVDDLSETVQVVFDDRLVPHIYAESLADAFFAQGYIQAKYRLWQMDITTRAAGGKLAEIMGENLLERDKRQRRLGMLWAAEKMRDALNEDLHTKDLIKSFCQGVNHYIAELSPREYPLEFKLLNYAPREYSTLDIALYITSMAQTLNSRESDLEYSNTRNWLGDKDFNRLFPLVNPLDVPVIPSEFNHEFEPLPLPVRTIPDPQIGNLILPESASGSEYIGSNNWAVNGDKTALGVPILCNDPHLGLTLPSVWFEIAIYTPELQARGVALPGTPGVVIGFNRNIAWGSTNVGQDVADWYLVRWTDDRKLHYMYDGGERPITSRIEHFKIRGGHVVFDTIKFTQWGPIVYEKEDDPHQGLAYRWITHDQGNENELYAFLAMSKAQNFAEFHRALRWFHAPAQNFVFADNAGDIALKVTGKFPIRARGQGRFVQDGSLIQNNWHGFIPYEQIPSIKNPISGYVASANQRSADTTYPYAILGGFEDYRGRLINYLLDSLADMDVDLMQSLQNNNYNLMAADCAPLLVQSALQNELDAEQKDFISSIRAWNYEYHADWIEPVMFERWFQNLYRLIWDEFRMVSDSLRVVFPETWKTIQLIEANPSDPFFDLLNTPEKESADELIYQALKLAIHDLDSLQKKKITNWAAYNRLTINHLARLPGFNSHVISTGGHPSALNAINGRSSHGPSWRMIVVLDKNPYGHGVYPGGQSGNPGSAYYDQFIQTWTEGKYYHLQLYDLEDWNKENPLFNVTINSGR